MSLDFTGLSSDDIRSMGADHAMRKRLEDNPQFRRSLQAMLREFPAPDEVSSVVNQLMDEPSPPVDKGERPRVTVFQVCVVAQLTTVNLLLALHLLLGIT